MQIAKTERQIPLVGVTESGDPARIGSEVKYFTSDDGKVTVRNSASKGTVLITNKGQYPLVPHESIANLFRTKTDQGIKIHFTKKKVVAKLIYWA